MTVCPIAMKYLKVMKAKPAVCAGDAPAIKASKAIAAKTAAEVPAMKALRANAAAMKAMKMITGTCYIMCTIGA